MFCKKKEVEVEVFEAKSKDFISRKINANEFDTMCAHVLPLYGSEKKTLRKRRSNMKTATITLKKRATNGCK